MMALRSAHLFLSIKTPTLKFAGLRKVPMAWLYLPYVPMAGKGLKRIAKFLVNTAPSNKTAKVLRPAKPAARFYFCDAKSEAFITLNGDANGICYLKAALLRCKKTMMPRLALVFQKKKQPNLRRKLGMPGSALTEVLGALMTAHIMSESPWELMPLTA